VDDEHRRRLHRAGTGAVEQQRGHGGGWPRAHHNLLTEPAAFRSQWRTHSERQTAYRCSPCSEARPGAADRIATAPGEPAGHGGPHLFVGVRISQPPSVKPPLVSSSAQLVGRPPAAYRGAVP